MPAYRHHLPQLDADRLPHRRRHRDDPDLRRRLRAARLRRVHAARRPAGPRRAHRYFDSYAAIARRDGVGIVLETRPGGPARTGARVSATRSRSWPRSTGRPSTCSSRSGRGTRRRTPVVISGCIGPRGDGYQVGATMTVEEARNYHALQARAFAATEADLVTAITMTYVEEAIGIAEAARAAGMPVVLSFTVETDGRCPPVSRWARRSRRSTPPPTPTPRTT